MNHKYPKMKLGRRVDDRVRKQILDQVSYRSQKQIGFQLRKLTWIQIENPINNQVYHQMRRHSLFEKMFIFNTKV